MNNFWIMLSHAYFSKLKAKSFIITTTILAVGIFIMANIGLIIDVFQGEDSTYQVAVIDESGELLPLLEEELAVLNEDITLSLATVSQEEIELQVEEGIYEGLLKLSYGPEQFPEAIYISTSLSGNVVTSSIHAALQHIQSLTAASQLDLSIDEVTLLNTPVTFTQEAIVEGARSAEELNQARGIVYILLFFIYFSVIMYANMIATEVATEKSSRVMEILISSVSPVKQMFAKIIGIGFVGLTQLSILLLVGYLSIIQNQDTLVGGFFDVFGFGDLSSSIIFYAIVFFLLGYFLYATLAALLGSLVSRIEDVQQMILPMTFLVMIGFFIAMFGLGVPDSTFITVTSYIPFFTPMVMFLRVGMLNISPVEPLLGIAILLLAIIILAIFGAKIYRGGVLMYGKSNSLKDIKKAIDLTKK
ncbi:ABC transporter permease [Alkalihalobacillus sp. MEB130]|uniref:ABC transporter permease n=1 Tax=Alkalihalobacillus sp. MEB130 TaxID=2976704 RepID=UPI0028DD6906|nr:ABC transporter permease [Alkalihalobacillus sp. MEB130]MDT8861249.1 ABC transporter permease [Alkalihalobacillus sp. MEB130]